MIVPLCFWSCIWEMQTEKEQFKNRIRDLADRCYQQNIYTFTGFLTLDEQAAVFEMERELSHVPFAFFGGTDACERKILRFADASMLGYEQEYPIVCLTIRPKAPKYAEKLTHRDYLGACMHLGISREMLGDIVVKDEKAYLFSTTQMAGYLCESLDKIRHTVVQCLTTETVPEDASPTLIGREVITASERADILIAKIFRLSRSQSICLFREKKIFVNGRQFENNSGLLHENDVISVRGHGKFQYLGSEGETKKGNIKVRIAIYG